MSEGISKVLGLIKNLFKYHKLKMFLVWVSALVFLVILFPYSDLADFTTAQVSKMTQNQVFLSFDDMSIGLVPTPSVDLEKVQVETAQVSGLKVGSLSIAPSIAALLSFKKGVSVNAKGLLKGNLDLTYKEGDAVKGKGKDKFKEQLIDASFEKVNLAEIEKLVALPVKLKGSATGELEVNIDPTFFTQPDGTTEINVKNFVMPAGSINMNGLPVEIPEIMFKEVKLKGRLAGSSFVLQEGLLGKPTDEINGKLKGKMTIKLSRRGPRVVPNFGSYNININLNISKQKESELYFLALLEDQFKQKTNKGIRVLMGVSGAKMSKFGPPPKMKPIQAF